MSPVGRWVRARLKRRIFVWFSGGLLTTMILVSAATMLVSQVVGSPWSRNVYNARTWAGRLIERDWDDPVALQRLVDDTARDLEAGVQVYDERGALRAASGAPCGKHAFELPVTRGERLLGQARMCMRQGAWGWQWLLMGLLGAGAVWFASGRVARRLARPLDQLVEVVRRIGQGDLQARTDLSCQQPDEIGVVAEAVNEMAARIEKQMADQRELLATVSHELRTPLSRIRLISELAREGSATPRTYDDLDREVVEMDALVGDLLAHSRVEFGQLTKKSLPVNDLASLAVERAGVDPSLVDVSAAPASVEADPTLLHRALANLFDNARRHAGGVDGFVVRREGERVRFEVSDRGPGVPDDPDRLFRKFTRGENGSSAGLGLGLALVKRIAEAHGGDVFAHAREGGGAVFGFWIRAPGEPVASRPPQ